MSSKNNGRISPSSGGAATQYIDFGSSHRIELSTGETGIGTTNTGYGIDLNNLSFSVAGTIETGLYFRRWGQISGVGPTDALWMLGRFVASPPLSASAGYAQSTTIGDSLTIVAINATQWVATSMVGSGWSVV